MGACVDGSERRHARPLAPPAAARLMRDGAGSRERLSGRGARLQVDFALGANLAAEAVQAVPKHTLELAAAKRL